LVHCRSTVVSKRQTNAAYQVGFAREMVRSLTVTGERT
jgi:hypothetical protein